MLTQRHNDNKGCVDADDDGDALGLGMSERRWDESQIVLKKEIDQDWAELQRCHGPILFFSLGAIVSTLIGLRIRFYSFFIPVVVVAVVVLEMHWKLTSVSVNANANVPADSNVGTHPSPSSSLPSDKASLSRTRRLITMFLK